MRAETVPEEASGGEGTGGGGGGWRFGWCRQPPVDQEAMGLAALVDRLWRPLCFARLVVAVAVAEPGGPVLVAAAEAEQSSLVQPMISSWRSAALIPARGGNGSIGSNLGASGGGSGGGILIHALDVILDGFLRAAGGDGGGGGCCGDGGGGGGGRIAIEYGTFLSQQLHVIDVSGGSRVALSNPSRPRSVSQSRESTTGGTGTIAIRQAEAAVPEPSTLGLDRPRTCSGLLGCVRRRRKR